jgi:hypothetical protein
MLQDRGNSPDVVIISAHYDVTCDDGYSDNYDLQYPASLFTRDLIKSFDSKEIEGQTLAMELPGAEVKGDNFIVYQLQFNTGGSGTVLDRSDNFEWTLSSGALQITFSNGDIAMFYKSQDDKMGACGVVEIYQTPNGSEFSHKGMVVKVDSSSNFENESDYIKHFRSGFDASQPNEYRDIGFFIELNDNGNAIQQHNSKDGNVVPYFTALLTWGIIEGKVIMSNKVKNGDNERCDPYSDSECWWRSIRSWQLLYQQGNRIYVKENIYYNFSRPDDNLAFPDLASSRINFYEVSGQ